MFKKYAVIEDNKIVNIIVGVEDEVVSADPNKYILITDEWTVPEGIDGGRFFPPIVIPEKIENE